MNLYKKIAAAIFVIFIAGCAGIGIFQTDQTLSNDYPFMTSDSDITIFYSPSPSVLKAAVKNTGNAFMTNLTISFKCYESDGISVTQIYSVGNLKPYFNKEFSVPIDYDKCSRFIAEYAFIPTRDGGFVNVSNVNVNGFENIPNNPVYGTLLLKEN